MTVFRRPALALASIAVLAASDCGESSVPLVTAPAAATGLAFTVQPSDVTSNAAITLAVQVAVQDALGNTVSSAANSISLGLGTNPASGTLSGTATVAAVNGVATFNDLHVDKAGAGYTLAATASGLTGTTSSGFRVIPGTAARLAFTVQPASTAAGAVFSLEVTVLDSSGNTVTSAANSITLGVGTNPGSGTLSGTTTAVPVNGVATFGDLSIDKTGPAYTLTAAASGVGGDTSTAFDVTADDAARLVFTVHPTNTVSDAAITPALKVAVRDASGNLVSSANNSITVAIGTNPAGGSLSGTATVAAVNGVATFSNLRIDKAGTGYTLTAAASGLTGTTSTGFNVTAGPATRVAFTVQPMSTVSGAVITPAVKVAVQDASGNPVSSANNSIAVAIGTNPAGGSLSGTATVAAVNGVATFSNLRINNAGTGYTLTAAASGLTGTTSTGFNVTAGPATRVAFTVQPTNTGPGAVITPAVRVAVQDASGNTVSSATNSITLGIGTNPASGTLSGTATVAAVNGVATFNNLQINNAGTGYTLTAAASGLTGTTSTGFNVTAGPAARVGFTVQPTSTVPGSAITPAVRVAVQDASGNTVSSANNSITVAIGTNPASGTLSGTATVSAVNGVATFSNLRINNAGTGYTLTAAASGLSAATSSAFNIATDVGGFRWESVTLPAAYRTTDFYAVATAGGKVWVSGANGTILHYTDAGGWVVQLTGVTGSDGLTGPIASIYMWVSVLDAVTKGVAVGGQGQGIRLYYTGTTWTRQSSGTSTLMSTTGVGQEPNMYWWACGLGGIVYTAFTPNFFTRWLPAFTTNDLYTCSGTAINDVFAAGANGYLAHFNGTTWTSTGYTTNTTERLFAVARCPAQSATTHMWLAGAGGVIRHAVPPFTTFTAQASGTTGHLYGMDAFSCTEVYAVGANGTILLYNGATWSPQASGTTNPLYGMVIRTKLDGTRDAWVVGDNGTILHGVR